MTTYRKALPALTADRIAARQRVQRGTHNLVLMAQGNRSAREVGQIAASVSGWWEDLRRGRLPVYGALLRFIDVSIAMGTPREVLLEIPHWIEAYILDLYPASESNRAA